MAVVTLKGVARRMRYFGAFRSGLNESLGNCIPAQCDSPREP